MSNIEQAQVPLPDDPEHKEDQPRFRVGNPVRIEPTEELSWIFEDLIREHENKEDPNRKEHFVFADDSSREIDEQILLNRGRSPVGIVRGRLALAHGHSKHFGFLYLVEHKKRNRQTNQIEGWPEGEDGRLAVYNEDELFHLK